jgi:hypothetical protein
MIADSSFGNAETVVLAFLIASYAIVWLIRGLRKRRPDFNVGVPIAVGVGIRLAAIAGISTTGLSATLRGGDEITFMDYAQHLAEQPFGRGFLPHGLYHLHTVVFALQLKLGGFTQGAIRITQVGLATLGILLIIAAVHDLAGGRAARLTAWILALEPASIFFNSALHKEPLMELASGLVVFGGAKIWRRLDPTGIVLCALGGLIAVETRSYAGWFLVSAAVLLLLHAAVRQMNRPMMAMPLIYAVAIVGFISVPVLLQASSSQNLQQLQQSQNANAQGTGQGSGGANSSNLKLEQVDYSTRGKILTNLPKRIRDVVLKPYPWQLQNSSQRFGAVGTLVAWAGLLLLIRYAWRNRGRVFPLGAPLLYPMLFMLVAYSLSAGNAGTSFRYRTHLVTLGLALMVVLREHALRARAPSPATSLTPASEGRVRTREPVRGLPATTFDTVRST